MSKDKLTKVEEKKLKGIISYQENSRYRPYRNVSGGFVESKILQLSEKRIFIELKYGVQNGETDQVYTEHIFIDRAKMKIISY